MPNKYMSAHKEYALHIQECACTIRANAESALPACLPACLCKALMLGLQLPPSHEAPMDRVIWWLTHQSAEHVRLGK